MFTTAHSRLVPINNLLKQRAWVLGRDHTTLVDVVVYPASIGVTLRCHLVTPTPKTHLMCDQDQLV
jgi:hypothetical protein